MQTQLADWARDTDFGREADEILRRCVHCGFCLATCPTYQILGDELDSPRGRIYQIKQVLEGAEPTFVTQQHLDRCLTCRNCETTCPSGVQYGALVDIGRQIVSERVRRPLRERLVREALRRLMGSPWFGPLYRIGVWVRPALPAVLRSKIAQARPAGPLPAEPGRHARQVLMLANCVQPAMMPSIDAATLRVLDAVGVGTRIAAGSGCCGAINFHLDAQEAGRDQMRANVDAWLPLLESGEVEAVIVNASGCGGMIKDYAHHLKHDPAYAERAARLMPYVKDIAEFLAPMAAEVRAKMRRAPGRSAFHPPCTLQHWQGLRAVTERLLADLGFDLQAFGESHLCCGSAGTYSITQPALSKSLRDRKLQAIQTTLPDTIVSSNIGCICHLQSGTGTPVRHWIETVDEALHD
ncbi:Glycolate dehydrogenase, iron-sulfur subunit GlcF [Castellaniella defragrans 65Phen]|uniref:Glycolate oxidase iron-sulfur subunit n=1 Tax=Castellaniella defragrans (strain DSM 12143 / CCUG 39792 / 65Phen) TaxID=1437824 RepID=W8X900_CASD6|nr:glycolate oxidase subunit GlcF [Castellaniella defragrans]CDM23960.1 Glycolate dehydrogenase, iron-sulfur subunit GlcF [Castellaniella defragrans 65Phen]